MVITGCISTINKTMLNIIACFPLYLSERHSFCSAEIAVCHQLQLPIMSSFISVKIKWKMSLETSKNSLNWISLSIKYLPIKVEQCPSSFLFLKCPLHPHSYSKSSSSSSSIMAGMCTSMFILQQPRCDYLQQQTQWFIVQACYHRQVKLSHVLKNHHLCVMQGSFHVVMD